MEERDQVWKRGKGRYGKGDEVGYCSKGSGKEEKGGEGVKGEKGGKGGKGGKGRYGREGREGMEERERKVWKGGGRKE